MTPVDNLLRRMKETAGSRFNAHKRLEHRDRTLTFGTAFVSAYVIALTILPYFLPIRKSDTDIIGFFTVLFSIFIIISTLAQFSGSYSVLAEQHHRCALEINEIRSELDIKKDIITTDEIINIQDKYNSILQKYSINHENVDYDKHRLSRPNEFSYLSCADKSKMHIMQCFSVYWLHAVLGTITMGFLLVIWFFLSHPGDEQKQVTQWKCLPVATEMHALPLLAGPPGLVLPPSYRN